MMHLEGPWLSTTGKKKGKVKFRNADEAKKARELTASWEELLKQQGVGAEEKRRNRAMKAAPLSYKLTAPPGRETKRFESLGQDNGVATLKPSPVYTGSAVLGIAVLHKSNAVPVFSQEEAIDISKMRRG